MSCVNKRVHRLAHNQTLRKYKCIELFDLTEHVVIHLENEKVDWCLWYHSINPKIMSMSLIIADLKNKITEVSLKKIDFIMGQTLIGNVA